MSFKENYDKGYLSSEHWKRFRAKALAHAGYRCRKCPATTTLQVHHLTYDRLGHELLEDVVVLCNSCHIEEHERQLAIWDRHDQLAITEQELEVSDVTLDWVLSAGRISHAKRARMRKAARAQRRREHKASK